VSTTATEQPVRILGVGGSLRQGSWSLVALKSALKMAADLGAETHLCDVRALDLPMYVPNAPLDAQPGSVHGLLAAMRAADGLFFCSPTYHGTVSGAVKNALDYVEFMSGDAPKYFGGRVVGLLGLGGAGAMNAINALYHTARTLNGLVVPATTVLTRDLLNADTLEVGAGRIHDRLHDMVQEVVELAALTRARREVVAR